MTIETSGTQSHQNQGRVDREKTFLKVLDQGCFVDPDYKDHYYDEKYYLTGRNTLTTEQLDLIVMQTYLNLPEEDQKSFPESFPNLTRSLSSFFI